MLKPLLRFFAAIVLVASTLAHAQYPNRPIKFIVPFPPGGGLDVTARTIQQKLSDALGVPIVVENRAGAAGTIGADSVAKGPADGYTILLGNIGTMALYPATYDKVSYNTMKDLIPVTQLISNSLVAVIPATNPSKTIPEFVQWVRTNPGKVSYASGGSGAITHLAGEMLKGQVGIDMLHVPYKGSAPAVTDLLGGQVQLLIDVLAVTQGHIKSGKLRAIGVTGSARLPALPDVPTFEEAGLKGYNATGWQGVFVAAGTPKDIVAKLNDALLKVMNDKEVQEKFVANGAEPTPRPTDEFTKYVASEIDKWTKIAKAANVKVDY
jgi:tripartite-type tricarboxylate transporter receptor subunit TctC